MNSTAVSDKEIFSQLVRNEPLRKLRVSFDFLLGHPIWWVSFKLNGSHRSLKRSIESSVDIWHDPRVKKFSFAKAVYANLKKRTKETRPFLFHTGAGLRHFCIPLIAGDRFVGFLGLSGIKTQTCQEALNLLTSNVQLILDHCLKKEELERLSATIRPRAIALSTVHTVHRIINSTLNLNELISRLAHLTAQVLRADRCAIYLIEKSKKSFLVCKVVVGFPKNYSFPGPLKWGMGIEGRVAKTAQTLLRKTFICVPLIDEDVIGIMKVSHKKDKKPFAYFDQEILTTLAEEAVIAIKNAQLYEEQKRVTLGTIQSLAVILGARVSNAHSPEIFLRLALKMADYMKLSEEEKQALHYATLLKDTAKIGIPDEILKKPSKLTGEEVRVLREHPMKGAKIVQSFESLKPVVPIILYSREKYDGTGYPKGLKGDKIPLGARLLSVINAFEAIITGRPYRDRASIREAVDEIVRNSGTQFDPKVVEAFSRIIKKENFFKDWVKK